MRTHPTVNWSIRLACWGKKKKIVETVCFLTFTFQRVLNDKVCRSLQTLLKVSNAEWVKQILKSSLHLNYNVNIHNINISFVITAIKSTWFYLRNNSSPILDLQDIKRVSLHWNKKRKRETRMHSLPVALTKKMSKHFFWRLKVLCPGCPILLGGNKKTWEISS